MSFTSVTVTGTIINPQSNPVAGVLVQFTLSQAMTDGVTQIAPQTISATTGSNGTFSVALVANDDPTTTPAGTYYKVLIGEPNNTQNFNVVVPHASAPTVDLFQLVPASASALVLAPSVSQLQAGTGIALSPASGRGIVTVTSTGGVGVLLVANNLSDVSSASTARTNLGLGSAATQATTAFDLAGASAPPLMPIVSRNLPVTDSSGLGQPYAAVNAVSANHGVTWRSAIKPTVAAPNWICLDMRPIPAASKSALWFIMRNPSRPTYQPTAALGSQASSTFQALPRNFVLQGHASSGTQPAVNDVGWTTLATITDNRRADLIVPGINLSSYNWFRVYITDASGITGGTDDVQFRLELRDVRRGVKDVIGIYGDSVPFEAFGMTQPGLTAWQTGAFDDVMEVVLGRHPPVFMDLGSVGGQNAAGALTNVSDYLGGPGAIAQYCDKIIIALGGNDENAPAYSGVNDPAVVTWIANMTGIVNYVTQTLGKTAIIPHMYGRLDVVQGPPNAVILNQAIDQIVAANSGTVIAGMDPYQLMADHPNLIQSTDHLHPTFDTTNPAGMVDSLTGYEHYHRLWVENLTRAFYNPGLTGIPAKIDVNVLASPTANTGFTTYATSAYARFTGYVSDAGTVNDFIEFSVNLKAGWYFLDTYLVGGSDKGALIATLHGGPQGTAFSFGTVDSYQASATDLVVTVGPVKIDVPGRHYLRYTTTAKNASSSSTTIQLRFAQLRRV